MNITPILSVNIANKLYQTKKWNYRPYFGSSGDTFEHSSNKIKPKDIYDRANKFDINEYEKLTEKEKEILRNNADKDCKEAAGENIIAGEILKNYLDFCYGKNNYVFCSIGTSPASLARFFEFSGIETKYLPLSQISEIDIKSFLKEFKKGEKLPDAFIPYEKFLEEQGLTPEIIQNSKKQYLFFDYTFTGKSLKNTRLLFDSVFDLNKENAKFISLNEMLEFCGHFTTVNMSYFIRKYLYYCKSEKYGGIPHLKFLNIEKADKCKDYSSYDAKRYNFQMIDMMREKGLLKINA